MSIHQSHEAERSGDLGGEGLLLSIMKLMVWLSGAIGSIGSC
jgi:hypothetical protein